MTAIRTCFTGSTDTRLFGATLHPGQKIFVQHMLSAWHMSDGSYFTAYPRLLDDWTFLGAPGVADVDGDGVPEVISGNGNGGLHAFHADGTEAVGWPKTVGRWLLASPAAGDFNGDGRTDVAVATRQGFVYVFTTNGLASAIDWSSLRGNPANTAVFVEPVA